jgi:hypothetical protein
MIRFHRTQKIKCALRLIPLDVNQSLSLALRDFDKVLIFLFGAGINPLGEQKQNSAGQSSADDA